MGDQEEVQEQMRADMLALKDQMASMMDAMPLLYALPRSSLG